MTLRPTRKDLEQLTEPTRSVALDALQRLLDDGTEEERAIEIAFREAEEWETSRHPGTEPPVESPHMARVRTTGADDEGSER